MKKVFTLLILTVFLMAAIGPEVRAHYCGGALVQVSADGMDVDTPEALRMPGCADGDGRSSYRNMHRSYKVNSRHGVGRVVLIRPAQSMADWFHGDLSSVEPAVAYMRLPEVVALCATSIDCRPGSHPRFALPSSGLRASPVA